MQPSNSTTTGQQNNYDHQMLCHSDSCTRVSSNQHLLCSSVDAAAALPEIIKLTLCSLLDLCCLQVFGNASHTLSSSPRVTFKFSANELVVTSNFWSSSSVMDGSQLTPLLAGFRVFTGDRNSYSAGGSTNWDEIGTGSEKVGEALSNWEQYTALAGKQLGVGLPVGAAAYVSDAGIHAFGFIYLAQALKQEL
jgi:hypothetical protein